MRTQNRISKKISVTVLTAILTMGMTGYAQGEKARSNTAPANSSQAAANEQKTSTPVFCPNEFSIWTAGGASALSGKPAFGERKFGFNGTFGLGYTRWFTPHWGALIGVEIAKYNASMNFQNLSDAYESTETLQQDQFNPEKRIFHTDIWQYKEKQDLLNVNIPLMAQFQTPLSGGTHQFYASLGAKLGIPVKSIYEVTEFSGRTWGYYHEGSQQPMYEQADLGYFPEIKGTKGKENLNVKLAWTATAEAGVKWSLSNKVSLYSGVYFDYGINNINKDGNKNRFVDFSGYREGSINEANVGQSALNNLNVNSMLTSQYTKNGETSSFVNKMSPIAFGVKLRLSFNICPLPGVEKKEANRKLTNNLPLNKNKNKNNIKSNDDDDAQLDNQATPENWILAAERKRTEAEYGKLKYVLILNTDGYEINQSYLSPIMRQMLDERLKVLQKYNDGRHIIIVEGHTCNLGREAYNIHLGQKRADVVRNYMITKGYNGANILTVSKGESTPIVPNDSEPNRKINRRVVFLVKEIK